MEAKLIRVQALKSRAWVAAMAGVSEPLAKIYEIDPGEVGNPVKREALRRVYEELERGLVVDEPGGCREQSGAVAR